MALTGSTTAQHGPPGHQTTGCDSKEHLDSSDDDRDDEDGCTNGLLRARHGVDVEEKGAINASKEAQYEGQWAREEASFGSRNPGFKAFLPPLVSLLNLI